MASHVFVKPAADPVWRRVTESAYVVAVTIGDLFWSAVEDAVERVWLAVRRH